MIIERTISDGHTVSTVVRAGGNGLDILVGILYLILVLTVYYKTC